MRSASAIAGVAGEQWFSLSFLLPEACKPQLLLIGEKPSLDLLLMIRLQGLQGMHCPDFEHDGILQVMDSLDACC